MGTHHAVRSLHLRHKLPLSTSTPTDTVLVVATQSLRSTCTPRRSHWPSWPLLACRRRATTTTRTATRRQLWPAPPTCRRPRAPLPRATCPAAEWVAAARRRPTRPSTRVPLAHRRPPEALLGLVWLLLACCRPVNSLYRATGQPLNMSGE